MLNGEGEIKSEKGRKKRLTIGGSSAIVSKLSAASGRASVGGSKKLLKSEKKALDKRKMVWYSNQAVRVAVADERSEKTSKEVEKRS